jgi:FdhD protein
MAGVPVLGAVSAPSSLAVELAEECGLTLAGFIRDGFMNIYTRSDRIRLPSDPHETVQEPDADTVLATP